MTIDADLVREASALHVYVLGWTPSAGRGKLRGNRSVKRTRLHTKGEAGRGGATAAGQRYPGHPRRERTPALAGQGPRPPLLVCPEALGSGLPGEEPAAALPPAAQPSEARQRPSLGPAGRADPAAPPHPRASLPARQPGEYSRRPRAARGRRGGDERPGTPRGGGAAGQGAGTEAGGRGRAPHASACRLGHAGPLCACSGRDSEDTCPLSTNRLTS